MRRPRAGTEFGQQEWLGPPLVRLLLRRVLTTLVIGLTVLSLVMAALQNWRTTQLGCIALAIVASLLLLERRGYVRSASIAACLGLLAVAGYAMATANGLNDSAIVVIPAVFIVTSILLGPRWLLLITALASVLVCAIAHAEIQGLLQTPMGRRLRYDNAVEVVVLLWLTAAMIHFLVSSLGQALAEARRARDSNREVFNATNEAIFIHDANTGQVLDVNETVLSMYRCKREEIDQFGVDRLSANEPPYDAEHAMRHIQRAIREGPQAFPWHARRATGELFWAEVSLRFANIANEPRVLAVVRDVSERRELERRVQEAEKLTAIGRLAGGVAHDFNNQLVGIIGNAGFLRDALGHSDKLRACAEAILDSGERAAVLTRQLLAFARKGRDRVEAVDLHKLIAEVITLIERSIDKRISIQSELRAEQPFTLGDPSALQNALLNLAINARDAMPSGGRMRFETATLSPSARGAASHKLHEGPYIQIRVSDTGIGMAPEIARRVFEPFFTTKDTGTGMGLSALYGTVQEHRGRVEVESEAGKGSTFTLLLPQTDAPPSVAVAVVQDNRAPEYGRVLVADDEPAVSQVVRELLVQAGYEVTTCEGGRAALECFAASKYDLVVLDVTMPDLDGVEVLARLRQQDPSVRALLMSGHASDALRSRLNQFGDIELLAKPFAPAELIRAVRDAQRRGT